MLNDFPRNTRVTLLLEPCSSVLACILTFYAALYMQGNGLDAAQIGLIASLAAVTGLIAQFVAAPVTNRLGRRRTLLLFSVICWSIPLFLWMKAAEFTTFLLASVVFSSSRITTVAWYCVATEDVREDRRAQVFGILFIISSIGGIATAFAGPVFNGFGLVRSLRFLYGFAFVSMTIMFALRHVLLTETRAGSELRDLHARLSLGQTIRRCLTVVTTSLKDREFFRLTLAFAFFNFALAMGFVQVLFLNNALRLTVGEISMIPLVAAIVSVTLFRFVVPRVREANTRGVMTLSLAVFAAGLFLLLLVPPRCLGLVLLASALIAAGTYLFQVVINTALNNRMGQFHKADVYSAVQLLVALVTIPAGWLAGSMFAIRPELAIGATAVVALAAAAILRPFGAQAADTAPAFKPEAED